MKQKTDREFEEFRGTKVLVTGGAGFVGSNLVTSLLLSGPREVVVVDNLLSSERSNLPDAAELTFIEGSIADDDILRGLPADIDYVFHLATYHGNQSSMHDPLADHENNLLPTLKLYDSLKDNGSVRKVVYSSAGCTVAEKTFQEAEATTEDAPVSLWLDSPYQISKIVGEYYSNYFFSRHDLPVVKARFQNVYGPGEVLGAGRWRGTPATVWRNVIPTFVYRAVNRMPLTVENRGIATRDFIYVDDIVRGLKLCALRGTSGDTYNLASGAETTILDLARSVNSLAENTVPIELRPARDWDHSGRRFGSTEKASKEIEFKAMVALEDGLKWTIAWTLENLATIESCIGKHDENLQRAD